MVKRTVVAAAVAAAVLASACGGSRPPEKFKQKLVILGFDGMDPRLVQKWMDEGKLPNFKRLSDAGGFSPSKCWSRRKLSNRTWTFRAMSSTTNTDPSHSRAFEGMWAGASSGEDEGGLLQGWGSKWPLSQREI